MSGPNSTGLNDNLAGALAYVTPIPAIVFLIVEPYNRNSYIRFHSWQSILLAVAGFAVGIVFTILQTILFIMPFAHLAMLSLLGLLSTLIWLTFLVIWIICVFSAYNGKRFKLPILGAIAETQSNK